MGRLIPCRLYLKPLRKRDSPDHAKDLVKSPVNIRVPTQPGGVGDVRPKEPQSAPFDLLDSNMEKKSTEGPLKHGFYLAE